YTYYRKAQIIRNGEVVKIRESDIFNTINIHEIEIGDVGRLEAFPNGDALRYLQSIGIEENSAEFRTIKHMGRYTMRWPGHCAFWKKLVDLHFLDHEPIIIDGKEINRRNVLAKIIGPHIQLKDTEKDLAILLIEVIGKKNGEKTHAVYQLVDKRDLTTGFTAMSRTVGYTVSIGAQLIGNGLIAKTGILSPVNDIPYDIFKQELKNRGIIIKSRIVSLSK
ncbi:MAG: hypothetical protein JSV04_09795, partial [Candidatus Heimdallarchaeota archaeon]